MSKIETVIDNLKKDGVDAFGIGICVSEMVSEMSLSYGEIEDVEEKLNIIGASMYEERYEKLNGRG